MSSSGISVTSYDYSPSRNVKQDQTRPYRGDSARLPQLSTSPAGVQSQALCSPKITIHTVDSLLKELTFIVATRKSDQYCASVSILDRYTSDTVPTYLLRSDNFLVRRLAAVLFAFVFQANNDVFKDKSEDPRENVCMLQNFLFLNPYKSAMKHFQPELLHCVSKPILYYLPKAQFPTGLPSFLDVDKLYSILVTKEYLRIPDPSETVIWLPYEYNMDNQLEISQQSLLRSVSHSSDEESDSQAARISVRGNNQGSEGAKPRGRETTHELPAKQPTDKSLRAMFKVKSKINQKQEEAEEAVLPTAEHRIKCFQFFKKVPQDTKSISPTKSNIQGTQRFRIQSIDKLKVRSASSASTTTFQGTVSAVKTETGLPKSRRSLMTNSAEVKPRMAAADREIRDWVTGRDYKIGRASCR